MKIVRLKKGYRLHLTDGEFEALTTLADVGTETIDPVDPPRQRFPGLSNAAYRALNGRFSTFACWHVDEDRRDLDAED